MIEIKNYQLNDESLNSISKLIELDINASSAFKLTRIIKEIASILEDKVKTEKKILDRYVIKDKDGNAIIPKDDDGNEISDSVQIEDMVSFNKDMSDLMDYTNTLNFDKLNFDELGLKTIKTKDLLKIDFLFN